VQAGCHTAARHQDPCRKQQQATTLVLNSSLMRNNQTMCRVIGIKGRVLIEVSLRQAMLLVLAFAN
jgi:hypothetical protein